MANSSGSQKVLVAEKELKSLYDVRGSLIRQISLGGLYGR